MRKQLKDLRFTYAVIKITQIRERFKLSRGVEEYKDKMFCAEIKDLTGKITSFCQPTLKMLFKQIKEEMWI